MHVFLLVLSIMGGPEHVVEICRTYQQCSDEGAEASKVYQAEFKRQPRDFTYRVVPATITPDVQS